MAVKQERINYACDYYRNSPDREILTPEGCRILLQVGEKALARLIDEGLPKVPASNSYRFPRQKVIEWMATEGIRLGERDSLSTKADRSV